MKCPNCGNEVMEGKKFCGKCGTKIELAAAPAPAVKASVCPHCNSPVTPGKKFCGKCGKPLAAVPAPVDNAQIPTDADMVMSAGFVHWNILPGQLAAKVDEKDLAGYKDIKGFVVQDGIKALFFADGALAGELRGGKYPFSDMGVETDGKVKQFFSRIASFFTGRAYNLLSSAASIIIVLMRDAEFPLIFTEKDMPTAGVRSEIAIHAMEKITNVLEFYRNQLLDQKFVSFERLAANIEPAVRTLLEDAVNGADPESVSSNAQMRETVLASMKQNVNSMYPYISVERILRLTASNAELDELRRMREELYVSEKELVELTRRNDFLNRLNDEKTQQLLREAQSAADFAVAMNKIDEQNALTEDEKAKFADMLFWQRKLREATSKDEGEAALAKLEQNGLIRAEELAVLKSDIEQRRKLKDLSDGQALAMLTLQNNMALDAQKLQWEIEIGNKRIENQLARQRMQDEYSDERIRKQDEHDDARRRANMDFEKEEQLNQLEMLRQAQALREERENAEHQRRMEAENAARQAEFEKEKLHVDADIEKNRIYAGMSAEQIMAANPDISEAAANALAEKFKGENAVEAERAKAEMASQHSADIERIMSQNAAQQAATMQQMMQMMGNMFAGQQAQKDAQIQEQRDRQQEIRHDAEAHQDRMENIINHQAAAAYGAAGKIYATPQPQPAQQQRPPRKDAPAGNTCPNCGAALEEGASFCGECGTSL